MATEKPSFYAILPANVRYDEKIPPNAKLLYAEISALIGKEGYCYASNAYFTDTFGFSDKTIARLIANLEENGYVKRVISRDSKGQVDMRKIYLTVSMPDVHPPVNFEGTSPQNCPDPPDKIDRYTNTSNTSIEKENKKEKADASEKRTPLTDSQLQQLFIDWISKIAPEAWTAKDKNALYFALDGFYAPRENRKQEPARTSAAFTALSNRLLRYSSGSLAVMIDMLERATTAKWRSVYPLNGDQGAAPPSDGGGDVEWL